MTCPKCGSSNVTVQAVAEIKKRGCLAVVAAAVIASMSLTACSSAGETASDVSSTPESASTSTPVEESSTPESSVLPTQSSKT